VPAPIWQAALSAPNPLSHFRNTPYNNVGAPAPEIVDAPGVSGAKAVRYTVPGGGKRTELEPQVDSYKEGDDAYFGFAWNLPADFPVNADGWQVVAQWKNDGDGSPPIEIKVDHGQFVLDGGAGGDDPRANYFTQPIGPAVTGQQTDVVLHIHFSTDPTKAQVDAWMNGQKRIDAFHPPGGTRYSNDDSYLKTGIYRDTAIDQTAVLYLIDTQQPFTEGDASFLGIVRRYIESVFIVQTKIDLWRMRPSSDSGEEEHSLAPQVRLRVVRALDGWERAQHRGARIARQLAAREPDQAVADAA